jgi:YidC/Oxa1 family membrane protein insertase
MIVQLPIWFALFRVLRSPGAFVGEATALFSAIQARDTVFLGMHLEVSPSNALSGTDTVDGGFVTAIPYLIAILVVVATGYYQQRQTMARTQKDGEKNPQQQSMQTVMKVLPVVFGVISWSFPAGLVLYFAVSQMFRIGQQAFILRLDRDREHTKQAEPRQVTPRPKPERPKPERPPGPRTRAAGAGAGKPSGSRAQQGSKKKRKRKR